MTCAVTRWPASEGLNETLVIDGIELRRMRTLTPGTRAGRRTSAGDRPARGLVHAPSKDSCQREIPHAEQLEAASASGVFDVDDGASTTTAANSGCAILR